MVKYRHKEIFTLYYAIKKIFGIRNCIQHQKIVFHEQDKNAFVPKFSYITDSLLIAYKHLLHNSSLCSTPPVLTAKTPLFYSQVANSLSVGESLLMKSFSE